MKPNALKVVAAVHEEAPLPHVARAANLALSSASIAVVELETLGLVRKRRNGHKVSVDPLPLRSLAALRDELARHPRLDLATVARGVRAGIVAGLGFARPSFLKHVTGASKSAMQRAMAVLQDFGVLEFHDELRFTIASEHDGLRLFCQDICDREGALELRGLRVPEPRILWTRSTEALVALPVGSGVPSGYLLGAYSAAAQHGVKLIAGERQTLRTRRSQSWADVVLQCLLVPPLDRLTLSHAAMMAAWKDPGSLRSLARWYGVEDAAGRIDAYLKGVPRVPGLLPRQEIKNLAREYGVSL